jgi:hypothetical protein
MLDCLARVYNRTAHIRCLCRKTTILSWHRCLFNNGVEKMNIKKRILTARCLYIKGNVGIQTIVYIFKPCRSISSGLNIDMESLQNRLLKVCYVPATSASLPRVTFFFSFLFFFLLLRPLTVLMKQTGLLQQSIFLYVYGPELAQW